MLHILRKPVFFPSLLITCFCFVENLNFLYPRDQKNYQHMYQYYFFSLIIQSQSKPIVFLKSRECVILFMVVQKEREKERKESEVSQSCLTLCDPTDCSLPGSFVHGILQARILEWVAISFSNYFTFFSQNSK